MITLAELKKQIPNKEERLKEAGVIGLNEKWKVTDNFKNIMYMDKEYMLELERDIKKLNSSSRKFRKATNEAFCISANIQNLDEKSLLEMLKETSILEDLSEEMKNIFKKNYGTYIKSNQEIINCSKRDLTTFVHIGELNMQFSIYSEKIYKLLKSSLIDLKNTLGESFRETGVASNDIMDTIYLMGHDIFKNYMNDCNIVRDRSEKI